MEILRGPVVRDVDRARHACVVEVFALYLGYFFALYLGYFSPPSRATSAPASRIAVHDN
jgi:hypothetical protein